MDGFLIVLRTGNVVAEAASRVIRVVLPRIQGHVVALQTDASLIPRLAGLERWIVWLGSCWCATFCVCSRSHGKRNILILILIPSS
jgi:hypothetical protein